MPGKAEYSTFAFDSRNRVQVSPTRVLVTGGAGYIGSTLVPMLLERGYEVTVFDNFRWGSAGLFHVSHFPNLHVVRGDICDRDSLRRSMEGQDVIYHLAGIVGFPACSKQPELAEAVNIQGTKNLTELLSPTQKIIFASTGSCYGAIEGVCTEETPLNPLTLYGKSKADGESMVLDKDGVCLRLATLFGASPRMRMDLLVNAITYKAFIGETVEMYESHFRRTFLHVRDAAKAFVMALDHYGDMHGQVYNVGDNNMNLTKLDMACKVYERIPGMRMVLSECGQDLDKRDYEVSYAKIRQIGFTSSFTIEDGITELIKVYAGMTLDDITRASNVL